MTYFFLNNTPKTESVALNERVALSVRKTTQQMLLIGAAAVAIQALFNLAIVISI